ncbi:MAG: hypothetical protein JWQ49_2230 [Edaphobacter sp.]|nr:hypothetical protein [Edaphobacter sp.]
MVRPNRVRIDLTPSLAHNLTPMLFPLRGDLTNWAVSKTG